MNYDKEIILDIYGNEYQERLEAQGNKHKIKSAVNAASKIRAIQDKWELHFCAEHFDVNEHCTGGQLEIPTAILHHPQCDLGTALLMFYRLGGLQFLYRQGDAAPAEATKRVDKTLARMGVGSFEYERDQLLRLTQGKILGQEFASSEISYHPKLSLVERDTLKRRNPSVDPRMIEKTPGTEYDGPRVWYKSVKRK